MWSHVHLQRTLPGFWRQFGWCLGRAVTRRMRESLAVFTDYAIFALTGSLVCCLQV
jgi:ABC-2 type transporter